MSSNIIPLEKFRVIDEQQLFLQPDFTLISLQKLLDTDFITLTTSLHKHFDASFLDVIRQKRINYVKRKIIDGTIHSVEEIETLVADPRSFISDYEKLYGKTPEDLFESQDRLAELKELMKAYDYDVSGF